MYLQMKLGQFNLQKKVYCVNIVAKTLYILMSFVMGILKKHVFRADEYFMLNQKVSHYSYPVSKNIFKVKNKTMREMCEICLKLIKLMILLLTHSVKPHAKPPSNSLFLKEVLTFVKIKKGRESQSWCRMGVNSLFTFGGNPFKASCMYSYSVLFLINSSRLSDSHFDENFCPFPY